MAKRNPLKKLIIKAWQKSVKKDYCIQRINSERSLQASFWSQLNTMLPENQRIFIEPPMRVKTRGEIKKLIPDIVICNKKEVICIIELKYIPRGQPQYQKDIESLALISQKRNQISISNKRYRGTIKDGKEYSLSENLLFVWAGIHAKPKSEIVKLYSHKYKSLTGDFIQLHAETNENSVPSIYSYE